MPYTIDPNDNTQSNFVYVGSGFDHQLSYIFQTMKLLVGIHTNSWRRHQGLAQIQSSTFFVTKYIWDILLKFRVN
jgi:hypothetical protein